MSLIKCGGNATVTRNKHHEDQYPRQNHSLGALVQSSWPRVDLPNRDGRGTAAYMTE